MHLSFKPAKIFITSALITSCTLSIFLFSLLYEKNLPSFAEIKKQNGISESFLFDRNGRLVQTLRIERLKRQLAWTDLSEMPPLLLTSVIAMEDKRFYEHHGIDWSSLVASAAKGLFGRKTRGASTISMQLAALLDERLFAKDGKRNPWQKILQLVKASALERTWSKEQILEAYLNLLSFRGEMIGLRAASRGLWGKDPHGLNHAESFLLAALIRSPNARWGQVARRACHFADSNACIDIKAAAEKSGRRFFAPPREPTLAPHFARQFFAQGTGEHRSTLDKGLQERALESLEKQLSLLSKQNVSDGAILVIDNEHGDILAYVGSGGKFSTAKEVDGIRAARQIGSAIKPLIYATAIEKKVITAETLLNDAPIDLFVGPGLYHPQNYDRNFHGLVTARSALGSSLNIPSIRVLKMIDGDDFVAKLHAMQFAYLKDASYYGPSLALGSCDLSLWDMVGAYRALANDGHWNSLRADPEKTPLATIEILAPEASFITKDILADREARSMTFGFENSLATPFWTAVKTGTSKDMRDNWCIGFSSKYTVGVWVGNFSGSPMWNVTGISGAAPIWLDMMKYLHASEPSVAPSSPPGVAQVKGEYFIAGTEPTEKTTRVAHKREAKIIYPVNASVLAIDPDIPRKNQKVLFEMTGSMPHAKWKLNGTILGSAKETLWTPKAGIHQLALIDARGLELDRVQFSVR